MARPLSFTGTGLFSGAVATLTIHPAPAGSGVSIRRAGSSEEPVPLTVNFLSKNRAHTGFPAGVNGRNTTIAFAADADHGFATIEHILSALAGLRIRDALLELEGPEIPILDGSSLPFVHALSQSPSFAQAAEERSPFQGRPASSTPYILPHVIEVIDPNTHARIRAIPRDQPGTRYSYLLDYGPTFAIPAQSAEFDSARDDYTRDVAPARTFSLFNEAARMQLLGLFKHITTRDMLVLDAQGQPIDNTFRFDNEPARHKLLDLIGDIALLGRPLQADITAERSGHTLTHELVREILRRSV